MQRSTIWMSCRFYKIVRLDPRSLGPPTSGPVIDAADPRLRDTLVRVPLCGVYYEE